MQRMTKKNLKVALPMLAAAAAGVWMVPSAKADFTVSIVPAGTSGGNSIYVAEAVNTPGPNNQTTTILGVDVTITTAATAGGIVTSIEGSTATKGVAVDGRYGDDFFGDPTGGTFVGIGDQPLPTPPTPYTDPNDGVQSLTLAAAVYTGTNVNPDFSGATTVAHGTGAVYTGSKTSTYDSGFKVANSLHALEVAATLKGGSGVDTSTGAIPFANIIVPTGTVATLNGQLSEDFPGTPAQFFTITTNTTPPPPPGGAKVLTATTASGTVTGTLNVTGKGSGSYNVATTTLTNGVTGSVAIDPFSPSTDEEIYGLRILENGAVPTNGDLATIVNEINSNIVGQGTATLTAPGTSGNVLSTSFFDVFVDITSPNINSNGTGFLNYDLSGSSTIGDSPVIAAIGVVPEPTGVGVLLLGGFGLLARRRKLNQIEA